MDIRKLLEFGQKVQDAEHAAAELTKRGNLRGGSPGCIDADGQIHGECHRKSLARMLGHDKPAEPDRAPMFDAGNANEDIWAAKLKAASVIFRREDECPVVWPVPGTDKIVTGRPDFLLGMEAHGGKFIPQFGLELKGVFSHSTAVGIVYENRPQTKHVLQAGFYSMALDFLPYAICYTNPAVIDLQYWAIKKFGAPKKLQPFYQIFYLRWVDGALQYRDERSDEWVATKFTAQGIADYYQLVAEMEAKQELGPRPVAEFSDGVPMPANWGGACGNCPFKSACDSVEDNYVEWLGQIKSIVSKGDNSECA
jgi:hypothetical protein